MLKTDNINSLRDDISSLVREDMDVLRGLYRDVRQLEPITKKIKPQPANSISLVATDGGNNQLRFDPFLIQLVRVVDSQNTKYCFDVISPTMSISDLSLRQFEGPKGPTALGRLMRYLGVTKISDLSYMIRPDSNSLDWVQAYRELVEWASLFEIVNGKKSGREKGDCDKIVIFDGFLRSNIFKGDLFERYCAGIQKGIERYREINNRRIYIVGIAKRSKVLSRYRLAMSLAEVLQDNSSCYVAVPPELERKTYRWHRWIQSADSDDDPMGNKFSASKMFFVKFGKGPRDPVWPVDIFSSQSNHHAKIFSYLLDDAIKGFPVPFYPLSLQTAHKNAALVDFDMNILQDMIFDCLRTNLGSKASVLDAFMIQDDDPASHRYG